MLRSLQMMSVNQIAAQIKLTEMWKALNDSQYPLRVEQKSQLVQMTRHQSVLRYVITETDNFYFNNFSSRLISYELKKEAHFTLSAATS